MFVSCGFHSANSEAKTPYFANSEAKTPNFSCRAEVNRSSGHAHLMLLGSLRMGNHVLPTALIYALKWSMCACVYRLVVLGIKLD